MLSSMVSGGSGQKADELDKDTLRSFLKSYERLRESEKRMVAMGYDDKHFTKGRMYARLLKNFAQSAQTQQDPSQKRRESLKQTLNDFARRPSLRDRTETMRPSSPPVLPKRVHKKEIETQTDAVEFSDQRVAVQTSDATLQTEEMAESEVKVASPVEPASEPMVERIE